MNPLRQWHLQLRGSPEARSARLSGGCKPILNYTTVARKSCARKCRRADACARTGRFYPKSGAFPFFTDGPNVAQLRYAASKARSTPEGFSLAGFFSGPIQGHFEQSSAAPRISPSLCGAAPLCMYGVDRCRPSLGLTPDLLPSYYKVRREATVIFFSLVSPCLFHTGRVLMDKYNGISPSKNLLSSQKSKDGLSPATPTQTSRPLLFLSQT